MTAAPFEGQNCSPTPSLILLDTPPPLACLHCAATQATVLRDRQILDARAGYPTQCVCCDCETGSACPKCLGEHLEYGPFDGGTDPQAARLRSSARDAPGSHRNQEPACTKSELHYNPYPIGKEGTQTPDSNHGK